MKKSFISLISIFIQFATCTSYAQNADRTITIHLRGVYDSKISLLALNPAGLFKPVREVDGIGDGQTTVIKVSPELLPGEFVLRFDYREKESSTHYPSEKPVFMGNQDLELWVSPMYANNPDSTRFQENELENRTFMEFSAENGKKRQQLGLLQEFLMNYDDPKTSFYRQGTAEYETRRKDFNDWLALRYKQDRRLFISSLYGFQHLPGIAWKGDEDERTRSLINHYFDGIDFSNPLLIKTRELAKWMDGYVNLYGKMATTVALRDSLFPLAGKTAIENSRKGDPLVYGWMVDYFYRGYESNGINAGMKVLQPYLDDPKCLTTKRKEIDRRLEGMKTLILGAKAPNIILNTDSNAFNLYACNSKGKYLLLLFWSAGCSHCLEMAGALYPWQQQPGMKEKLDVVAVSLDETDTEIKAWQLKVPELKGWKHLRAKDGVRSKEAADYFILSTPVMVLLDPKTFNIISVPESVGELKKVVE